MNEGKESFSKISFKDVSAHLLQGGVIAYPTETVWGLGCLISKEEAVQRVFDIKKRPEGQALSVLIEDINQAEQIADFSLGVEDKNIASGNEKIIREVLSLFWPGPVTFVFSAENNVSEKITSKPIAGRENKKREIGMRCSPLLFLQELLQVAGEPIVTTSANISGEEVAKSKRDLSWLPKDVLVIENILAEDIRGNMYRNGEDDNSQGQSSTVVRLSSFKDKITWSLLRKGVVSEETLLSTLVLYGIDKIS